MIKMVSFTGHGYQMTKLINIKDAPSGWRNNPDYIYCGRPGFYGNPFEFGKDGDRDMVCDKFEKYFYEEEQRYLRLLVMENLRGKVLVCYCDPLRCHVNTYVEFCKSLDRIDSGTYE